MVYNSYKCVMKRCKMLSNWYESKESHEKCWGFAILCTRPATCEPACWPTWMQTCRDVGPPGSFLFFSSSSKKNSGAAVKKQLFECVSKRHEYCSHLAQHVLIETTYDRVMIRLFIVMSKLTFLDFGFWILYLFCNSFVSNIKVKNEIFHTCFRQRAKGKTTAYEVQ